MPYNPNGLCRKVYLMRGSEFTELKAFVAVVERQSFARAAEHLGVSPSALSQTIRQLEGRLGTRLLNRTTRSVAPSASGGRLYARIAPLFEELAVAVAETREATGRVNGTLRINTLGIAARTLIAPRLARFHQAYPDVVVDIVVDDALSDIVSGRFDAGIRVGGQLEKDMVAIRLTPDLNMVAVASPDYVARRGTPRSPTELQDHACINWRLQSDGRQYRWEFKKRGRHLEVAVDGPVVTNHADVGIAAALAGLGIAYHFEQDRVGELLAQGLLVRVLADWSVSRPGLFLYYPNRRHRPALLGAFIDCLLDQGVFGNR
ncbi:MULTISPECIES: LysR family transcriptional regulator [Stenotrophomonas]|uniref:LysR family transcriptional regulator n=3 Tax=Stenotrophomonas TaxID=40323 RepID=A0AAP5EZX1_9GAMM|nr:MULTISPECIES: LysR family transcriptional regulator [Stenotrophomonas]MCI1054348.1 LysR family transcriptional regulator [Stenotrophomonas maltophilia]MCI1064758.1 LysR family transcriptional regulator [Stenotrophomonas maltophilia]MCI1073303.1 LysR family transcriptional regulator [Stenotrophomonas maltophilia]MCI1085682.1 LysR family transcriptional regulator [Stenotrophomonas maltophilia]MCI1105878.1 LysR family transcriptional regulator [Stenotrophomonas maltophilia]